MSQCYRVSQSRSNLANSGVAQNVIIALNMSTANQNQHLPRLKDLSARRRRIIRAWCMYDWANSAFATSGTAAILPIYFVFLFKEAVGDSGVFLGITFTGSSVWSLGVAISTAVVALTSPVLGVIADRVPIKKTLLWAYTIMGCAFTCLSFLSAYTSEPWIWLFGVFMLANVGFAGSLVFYNVFLPHIAPDHLLDDVSSRGFAYGYVGGGLLLAVHLAIIMLTQDTEFADLATRAALLSIGVWWFGWALWTLRVVPEPPIHSRVHGLNALSAILLAVSEMRTTFAHLSRLRVTLRYLGSYLLFNDGVQTVTAIAGAFAADTLGIPLVFNMITILMIQFVAAPGAMLFSWIASKTSTKLALILSLIGWIVVVLFGIALAPLDPAEGVAPLGSGPIDWWPQLVRDNIWAPLEFDVGYQWVLLGAMAGLVLGGSQALARSLFAQITPETRSGEFFSFFGFMSRASSVFGPMLYVAATAFFDTRVAILSILILIVLGTIALRWVDVDEGTRVAAQEDARRRGHSVARRQRPDVATG